MNKDIRVEVDLTDIKKMFLLPTQVNIAVQQAIIDVMEVVYAQSQQLVPVDTGALRGSGVLEHPAVGSGAKPEASITYGNDIVDYAVYVHEDLRARHKAPTQAKFLEAPFVSNLVSLRKHIQTKLDILIRKV